jgi:two-component system sensor histidine kinase KdpD
VARGQLRIYLGAAPGVGKTFAMLNEGRRRAGRGTDVVAGFVETHGRPRTAEAVGDLEVVPRRVFEHRGTRFEEMDVDAVLARRPHVALVDELAHTNVPGSRNEKRWQDVLELLDAGIDVISTVNIQHLESVNDVVERITGVQQRETVPDGVVREADQVELVDMTPEALRRRMAHGNIYPAERVEPALTNYFRPGNLTALRELALLWVADRVDESLEDYRERHGITEPWETRERVVVALTGAPGSDDLIRRAARMAQRSHGELLGVHVRSGGEGLTDSSATSLQEQRVLLESLGGEFHEVVGNDIARALTDFARIENCTQLVLGASDRSRLQELLRGSVVNRVIRASGPIDVHVISRAAVDSDPVLTHRRPRRRSGGMPARRQIAGWISGAVLLVVATTVLALTRELHGLNTVLLVFTLVVVVVAVIGGFYPAMATSIGAFALADYYFTAPVRTFAIKDGEQIVGLVVFLAVAAIVSVLVAIAARRTAEATRARAEAEILAGVAAMTTADDPMLHLVRHLRSSFGLDAVAILRRVDGGWTVEAAAGSDVPARPDDADLVDELVPGVVLALRGRELTTDDRRVLAAFGSQLAGVLERSQLSRAAASAGALAQANELRTALLQAVSHDLRTPLAAIKASVSSLRQTDVEWSTADRADFLAAIEDQTDRLTALVANLLDMSRLQAGVIEPRLRAVGFEEVVHAAVASLAASPETVEVEVPESVPAVLADAALLERVVANLVGNAVTASPPGTRVRVMASPVDGRVALHVVDRGPGVPAAERARVVEPFHRTGDARSATGVGLGLAVARGFVDAMRGELLLEDTPGGGLTAIVTLPRAPSS